MYNRLARNLEWLCNHPPTNIINDNHIRSCDYCGSNETTIHFENNNLTVCSRCLKKALDKALNPLDSHN